MFSTPYGQKVGLGTPLQCAGSFTEVIPGVGTLTGTLGGEILRVPPGS